MRLQATYTGPDAQRFAQEPPPYGAGWPDVAHEAGGAYSGIRYGTSKRLKSVQLLGVTSGILALAGGVCGTGT